jgi:hypothetical protein
LISSSSSGRASATTSTIVLVGKFDPKTSRAFVDIAWFRPVGGEHVQRDDIVDRTAGGFDSAFNLFQDETRLGLCVADADDLAVMVRCVWPPMNTIRPGWAMLTSE